MTEKKAKKEPSEKESSESDDELLEELLKCCDEFEERNREAIKAIYNNH